MQSFYTAIGLIEWPYSQSVVNCCSDTYIGQQFVFFSMFSSASPGLCEPAAKVLWPLQSNTSGSRTREIGTGEDLRCSHWCQAAPKSADRRLSVLGQLAKSMLWGKGRTWGGNPRPTCGGTEVCWSLTFDFGCSVSKKAFKYSPACLESLISASCTGA